MDKSQTIIKMLDEKGVAYELFEHEPVFTIADVEKRLNVLNSSMAKSLVMEDRRSQKYFVVVLRGCDQLDKKRLAKLIDVPRDVLDMAKPEAIEKVTGYPIGGVPPFGHNPEISVIVDQAVMNTNPLYCGAGSLTKSLKIEPSALEELNSKIIITNIKKS